MNSKIIAFISSIPGWLSIKEAQFLEKIVFQTEDRDGAIVEICSFCGKSTICLAQSHGKVYAIDPHLGNVGDGLSFRATFKKFIKNIKMVHVFNKIIPIVSTSEEASKSWDKKIRILFIDGLHDLDHATLDFDLWSKYVVDGGIIAIHDSFLRWCGSETVAMQRIVMSREFYKIGVIDSITYGIKGKGNVAQKLEKIIWQVYILGAIQLNHIRIVFMNLHLLKYRGHKYEQTSTASDK